ncbi:MAG: hypothetical protein AVO35_06650 [Candidatus Aegiribacteria sp. MLS_C]|nr:MAG: hypothetical protein AVO35_06650 [Candidatus Aegiribacteria sp. MLS_C]
MIHFLPVLVLAFPPACEGFPGEIYTSTFSIVAIDTLTGELGVGVASKVLDVGYIVPWGEPGAGAVATQAQTNAMFGPLGVGLLMTGTSAQETLDSLISSDPDSSVRQLGIVDARGGSASFTGSGTIDWAGSVTGPGYAIQGNILTGPEVVQEMEDAFLSDQGPLGDRLLAALAAGDAAGGDSRGRQSAALVVYRRDGGYQGSSDLLVDIRVADARDPIGDLGRIYSKWCMWFVFPVYIDAGYPEADYALDIMEDYLASGEPDAQDLNGLAWELAIRKLHPERAVEIALMASELAPEDPNIMDTVAESYYASGDPATAVEWETKALELDPGNAFFLEQLDKFTGALDETTR